LFAQAAAPAQARDFHLPPMLLGEQVVEDYRTLRLSLKTHPVALLRQTLHGRRVTRAQDLETIPNGRIVRVCGLVLVRQRPGTASGVIFMTLEDETHIANVVVWPKIFERYRPEVLGARLCAVDGKVQSERGVIHIIAQKLWDYSPLLAGLSSESFEPPVAHADGVRRPGHDSRQHPRNLKQTLSYETIEHIMPKGRNFH